MTFTEQFTDYINAAFSGIWLQTHEPDEAQREIVQLAQRNQWRLAVWDVASGLRLPSQPAANSEAGDPLAALRALPALADPNGTAILLLHNFHRFFNNPEVVQTTFNQLIQGKQQRTFIVVLSPIVQIPHELEKLFVIVEHPLPDKAHIGQMARELTAEKPEELPNGDQLQRLLDSAAGLTRYQVEGAFALSLARHGSLRPEVVWDIKTQELKKSGLLTLHRGGESFDSLGGLQSLKDFCRRALQPGRKATAKGVLLLGVAGSGKSCFAKALGNETGRPTLTLDLGALYGSLVGATEANVRQALRIADAMQPCILYVDEIEKGLAGVGSQGDSGVSTRLFGTVLSWLADHESDVFFIGTANDISRLPPEFTRAERLDGVFFLDLPEAKDKDAIWSLYRRQFAIPDGQSRPDDTSWTGAEIRACCRLSALLDVPLTQAARNVVPVAVTAAESVEKLRNWAAGRCLSASQPGTYSLQTESTHSPRLVRRNPSRN